MEYLYDHEGTRVEKSTNGLTTFYPSLYFTQTSTGTSTTLVMLGNENIATIQDGTVLWNHTDHLGSTVATTNLQGNTVEQTKYSAFGHQISRSTFQNTSQTEKYTGHTYDAETDLLYAQARYYRGSLGRFLGQDAVFWEVGQSEDGKQILNNPQFQNSYSYSVNNPIRKKDPTGKIPVDIVADAGFILYDLGSLAYNVFKGNTEAAATDRQALGLDVAGAAVPYATGFGMAMRVGKAANVANDVKNAAKLSDDMLVCRGGGCSVESFIKGSNEFRNGLNPTADTPLTGISVNVGKNIEDLLTAGPVKNYGSFGVSPMSKVNKVGGSIITDKQNGVGSLHGNIGGLNANQLNKLFTPVKENIFKSKSK